MLTLIQTSYFSETSGSHYSLFRKASVIWGYQTYYKFKLDKKIPILSQLSYSFGNV